MAFCLEEAREMALYPKYIRLHGWIVVGMAVLRVVTLPSDAAWNWKSVGRL